MMTAEAIRDNDYCFACGELNPLGLHLRFSQEGSTLTAVCRPGVHHQGYEGVVHGGIIATILDDVMSNLVTRVAGAITVTAELKVRLRRPARVEQTLRAEAEMIEHRGRLYRACSKLLAGASGEVIAEGESTMMELPLEGVPVTSEAD